MTLLQSWI
ncbi:hypothetical protein LINGRAHAP2_LOCUS34361 [Linum grandiflorum]